MEIDFTKRGMDSGPYLVFVKVQPQFGPLVTSDEWNLVADNWDRYVETQDAILAWFPDSAALLAASNPPYWCELLDVVSVLPGPGLTPKPYLDSIGVWAADVDEDQFPILASIVDVAFTGPERPTFGLKLAVIVYGDEVDPRRHLRETLRALGGGSEIVWRSGSIYGVAFSSPRQCQELTEAISFDESVFTAGVFRMAGRGGLPVDPTPLSLFLNTQGSRSSR